MKFTSYSLKISNSCHCSTHQFGGIEFRLNKRELGHIHGDCLADLPFPMSIRNELVNSGRASPRHVLPPSRGNRKISPLPPISPPKRSQAQKRGKRGEILQNGGGIISTMNQVSPPITSEFTLKLSKSGGIISTIK